MSELFWLSDAQMERLKPFFPKSRGKPRVDDRRVLSGIIFIQRNGLMWKHAPQGLRSSEDTLQSLEAMESHAGNPGWRIHGHSKWLYRRSCRLNSSGAVAKPPKHLIGFQKLFHSWAFRFHRFQSFWGQSSAS